MGLHLDCRPGAAQDDSRHAASLIFPWVEPSKEPALFGLKSDLKGLNELRVALKAERFRLHARSHPLDGISRSLKAEEQWLQPGEPGLEGEEPGLEGEEHLLEPGQPRLEGKEQLLKAEELFFDQPEPRLQQM